MHVYTVRLCRLLSRTALYTGKHAGWRTTNTSLHVYCVMCRCVSGQCVSDHEDTDTLRLSTMAFAAAHALLAPVALLCTLVA